MVLSIPTQLFFSRDFSSFGLESRHDYLRRDFLQNPQLRTMCHLWQRDFPEVFKLLGPWNRLDVFLLDRTSEARELPTSS